MLALRPGNADKPGWEGKDRQAGRGRLDLPGCRTNQAGKIWPPGLDAGRIRPGKAGPPGLDAGRIKPGKACPPGLEGGYCRT
jgi:hypothetical protein